MAACTHIRAVPYAPPSHARPHSKFGAYATQGTARTHHLRFPPLDTWSVCNARYSTHASSPIPPTQLLARCNARYSTHASSPIPSRVRWHPWTCKLCRRAPLPRPLSLSSPTSLVSTPCAHASALWVRAALVDLCSPVVHALGGQSTSHTTLSRCNHHIPEPAPISSQRVRDSMLSSGRDGLPGRSCNRSRGIPTKGHLELSRLPPPSPPQSPSPSPNRTPLF